jgi:predicted metal-dependent hydrolase
MTMDDLICVLKVHKNAKKMHLRVTGDGVVEITKPKRVSDKKAHEFARASLPWIQERLIQIEDIPKDIRTRDPNHYRKYKKKAEEFLLQRVEHINKAYQFTYRSVAVRNQKSRWGSCSAAGNLNFNYKILFLPKHLQDYLITHELCHIGQMNHSQSFWGLVSKTIPEYKQCRAELKRYSW